ncbi:coiled-coil domain containing 169 isoform X3 [Stegostoma tigrinum]|uniref:coiled-coil domain containing 169 isoform X3 n=1 Tax=Stegostoma tigrinum TaxID=3053191 RepID=UPI00202B144B|nr:coiled-coil domain containing 169 isoform X3 [Stegostoma tigrinum]
MYCSDFQNQMSMLQPEQPCLSSQINHQNGCGYSLEGTLQVICEEPHSTSPVRDMLDLSASDLRNTVSQLEKQLDRIEDEGNEWKTRYETQQELNLQLERQIRILEEKKEYIRGNPTDRLSSIRSYEEMPVGLLKQLIKQLEKEKKSLENQLKNFEWRIEQEAKAYHKANNERRTYLTEIAQVCLQTDLVPLQSSGTTAPITVYEPIRQKKLA